MGSESLGGITQETIDMTRQIIGAGVQQLGKRLPTTEKAGAKDITVASNFLFGYPLEAPSKKLYPIEDSMRRRVPRWLNPVGGTFAHWKVVTAINSAKIKAGVAEGALNTKISITDAEKSAKYVTLNMAGQYTDESRFMGRRFEDVAAYAMLSTLQSLMIQEDRYIIGGTDCVIGKPSGVLAAADSATAGSLSASTAYDFAVSALNLHGYLNGATGRVGGVNSNDETDAVELTTYSTGVGITAADLSWTAVKGAWAYNVFARAHLGTYQLIATVTTNRYTVLTVSGTAAIPNTADTTADAYGYQGLSQQIVNLVTGSYGTMTAYYKTMNGAELNGDGAAGISEIDTALQNIWNTARISPTVMLVNAQESRSMKALAIGAAATNATRITVAMDGQAEFKAGAGVTAYYNPFTAQWIPIITSLHCAPGTILLIGERVPYPNAETPNNIEIELQQEYYAEEFARTSRQQPLGVTCIGAQKLYFPAACGIIQCIAPTT